MRVLVTGITGFCGSNIARHLMAAGARVVGVTKSGDTSRIEDLMDHESLKLMRADLAARPDLDAGFDVVVHAAGEARTSAAFEEHVSANVVGTSHVVAQSVEKGAKLLVNLSTVSVYGSVLKNTLDEEDILLQPGTYGTSKYLAELAVREAAISLPSVSLRMPGVVGPRANENWLTATCRSIAGQQRVRIWNPESPYNNAVHIKDVCGLIENLIERMPSGFDTVNVASDGTMTVREAVELMKDCLSSESEIVEESSSRSAYSIDVSKAKQEYGFLPMHVSEVIKDLCASLSGASA